MMKRKVTMAGILFMLVAAMFITAGCDGGSSGGVETTDTLGVDPVDDDHCLKNDKTFSVKTAHKGMVKVWVPSVPEGCKVPVIHLANGTTAQCWAYNATITNLAKHGFVMACYESPNTGQGTQAITAIKDVLSRIPAADPNRIGFMGHSQGGSATMTGLWRGQTEFPNAIKSGLAMQPAAGFGNSPLNWPQMYRELTNPVCMFNGTADVLVVPSYAAWAWNAMTNADQFRVWYTATSANSTHIPPPNGPTQELSIPWFRWTLLGDANACDDFKALQNTSRWRLNNSHLMPQCH